MESMKKVPTNWAEYERGKRADDDAAMRRDRARVRREKRDADYADREWRRRQRGYETTGEAASGSSDRDTSIRETTYDPTPRGDPAVYRHVLGTAPKCGPDDRMAARGYLFRIEQALKLEGLSGSERNFLRTTRAKWKARAEGRDARFMVAGTRGGKLDSRNRGKMEFLTGPQVVLQKIKGERTTRQSNPLLKFLPEPPKKVRAPIGKKYWDMTWDQIRALHA